MTMPLSGTICRPYAETSYDQQVRQIWSLYSLSRFRNILGD